MQALSIYCINSFNNRMFFFSLIYLGEEEQRKVVINNNIIYIKTSYHFVFQNSQNHYFPIHLYNMTTLVYHCQFGNVQSIVVNKFISQFFSINFIHLFILRIVPTAFQTMGTNADVNKTGNIKSSQANLQIQIVIVSINENHIL